MTQEHLVEILLSSYNGEKYITQQLDSIISQEYRNWILLIRDDGSTDRTPEILDRYRSKDSRIKIIRDSKGNIGARKSFLELLTLATADYILFSDQDDVWLDNKISQSIADILHAEKSYGKKPILVYTNYQLVDERLHHLDQYDRDDWKYSLSKNAFTDLIKYNRIPGCTMCINRQTKELAGSVPANIEMYDSWLAWIASTMGKIIYDKNISMLYRRHENNFYASNRHGDLYQALKVLFNCAKYKSGNGGFIKDRLVQSRLFYDKYGESLSAADRNTLLDFMKMETKNTPRFMFLMVRYFLLNQYD